MFIMIAVVAMACTSCHTEGTTSNNPSTEYLSLWKPSTKGISEKAKIAVERSENTTCPNNDFRYVIHFPKEWKIDYTGTKGKSPKTCMNTVSAFYSPKANWASCSYFISHLKQLGFKETQKPKPGDIVIFFKKNNAPGHAGLYVGNSLLGPLMNHADGGNQPYNYEKHLLIEYYMLKHKYYIKYKYYTPI